MFFKVTEPYTCTKVDEHALQAWEQEGVLRITELIPSDWFTYLRQRVIEILGSAPESPQAWTNLEPSLLKPIGRDKHCVPLEIESVKNTVDSLIGKGWEYPNTGGMWFANAPRRLEKQHSPALELAPRGTWHWDGRPDLHTIQGLWLFTPVTEILPNSGGTWIVAGSARKVLDFWGNLSSEKRGNPTRKVKKWFTADHEWFKVLNSRETLHQTEQESDSVRLMNVSGKPGDVVLMKNFTIHSAPEYIGPGPRVCHVVGASATP
ncbi:MAG: hypothetical protein KF832_02015 [Caldilineaceae bacterium]|nr:hypothetical protein [Caldilineaceae bacterium]